MMQVAEYKDLYTHFLEFYKNELFVLNLWEERIDSLKTKIAGSVVADTFRTLDYGFTLDDFNNSFSSQGYSNAHVKFGLKQFINLRNNSLTNQLNYLGSLPIAYQIDYYPKNPSGEDSIYFYVSGFCHSGILNSSLKVKVDNGTNELMYPLFYSPIENTLKVEENDRYVGVIPPMGSGKRLDVRISLTNGVGQTQFFPRSGFIVINTQVDLPKTVVINEFLADNKNTMTDPDGEHDDWIELYNTSNQAIVLSGKYLTDNPTNLIKWQFPLNPEIILQPNEFIIVWLDDQVTQPGLHASFKISKSGEYLAITENDGITILDSLTFGQQQTDISFGRYTDGLNNWEFMLPTPGTSNLFTGIQEYSSPINFEMNVFPNPFNPTTNIIFSIPKSENTTIIVYDILGREVLTLLDEYKVAGSYLIELNSNKADKKLSSGMYLCRIKSDEYVKTEKILLLK